MSAEPLYSVTVESPLSHQRLLQVSGERATVIEMALRVILDHAPDSWRTGFGTPAFTVNVFKVKP